MIPDRLKQLLAGLAPGQTLALHFPTLEGARKAKTRIERYLRAETNKGALTLQYAPQIKKNPTGGASLYIHCTAPIKAEVLQPTEDGVAVVLEEELTL